MSKYGLFGDGTHYEGEPDVFQYGKQLSLNWGYDSIPNFTFNKYDHLGEETVAPMSCCLMWV